jgi:threonine synthase
VETDQYEEWLAPVFRAVRFDDPATLAVMREVYDETGLLVDPHTAIGIGAARSAREPGVATVALGTAHPAKFPDAVEQATGIRPSLPPRLADLYELPERTSRVANDLAAVQAVVARHRARR